MTGRLEDLPLLVHVVLLTVLAARLVQFAVIDKAGTPLRWLLARFGSWGRYLADCPVCASVWCSAGVVTGWVHAPGMTLLAGVGAVAAFGAGIFGVWAKQQLPPDPE